MMSVITVASSYWERSEFRNLNKVFFWHYRKNLKSWSSHQHPPPWSFETSNAMGVNMHTCMQAAEYHALCCSAKLWRRAFGYFGCTLVQGLYKMRAWYLCGGWRCEKWIVYFHSSWCHQFTYYLLPEAYKTFMYWPVYVNWIVIIYMKVKEKHGRFNCEIFYFKFDDAMRLYQSKYLGTEEVRASVVITTGFS
jgi:hypothetical protein